MTKIKNTKKGMAKKTLSMSLVVAMLATSNVPVWAAEFSDGSDAAVATEAPVVEDTTTTFSDDVAETPVVENENENVVSAEAAEGARYDFSELKHITNPVWGNSIQLFTEGAIKDENGTDITSSSTLRYKWQLDGMDFTGYQNAAYNIATNVAAIGLTKDAVGKNLSVRFYEDGDPDVTITTINLGTVQAKSLTGVTMSFDDGGVGYAYTGQATDAQKVPTAVNNLPSGIDKADFDWSWSGCDGSKVGTVTVTGTLKAAKAEETGYAGTITGEYKIVKQKNLTSQWLEKDVTVNNKEAGEYTGSVIELDKDAVSVKIKGTNITLPVKKVETDGSSIGERDINVTFDADALNKTGNFDLSADPVIKFTDNKVNIKTRDLSKGTAKLNVTYKVADMKAGFSVNPSRITLTGADGKSITADKLGNKVSVSLKEDVAKYAAVGTYKEAIIIKSLDSTDPASVTNTVYADLVVTKKNFNASAAEFANGAALGLVISANAALSATSKVEYTGEDITFTEKQLGSFLPDGTSHESDSNSFTITYANNKNASVKDSVASITVAGKAGSDYEGCSKTFYFKINPADVTVTNDAKTTDVKTAVKDTVKGVEYVEGATAESYKDAIGLTITAKNDKTDLNKTEKTFTLVDGTDYDCAYEFVANNTGNDTTDKLQPNDDPNTVGQYVKVTATLKNTNYDVDVTNSVASTINGVKVITKKNVVTAYVPVVAKTIAGADVTFDKTEYVYTGDSIKPVITVKSGNKTLKEGKDYTVKILNGINVGTATAIITAKAASGYREGSEIRKEFQIVKAKAEDIAVEISYTKSGNKADIKYDGEAWDNSRTGLTYTVKLGKVDVSSQFKPTWGENINAGKTAGKLTLTPNTNGKKNFEGVKEVTFEIKGETVTGTLAVYDENGTKISSNYSSPYMDIMGYVEAQEYTGSPITFAKTKFTATNKKLTAGKDYEITYIDNTSSGTAYVCVTGKGNYVGTKSVTLEDGTKIDNIFEGTLYEFDITGATFTAKNVTVSNGTYASGLVVKPNVTIVKGNKTLVEGVDYKIVIDDTEKAINATTEKNIRFSIKGLGEYNTVWFDKDATGKYLVYGIDKFDFKNANVTSDGKTVTVRNGNVVVPSTEYTSEIKDGKVTITATEGNKNYTGTITTDVNDTFVGAPVISNVKVTGNKATVILSDEAEGASGYDYVISTSKDPSDKDARIDVVKNQVQTTANFKYVPQGTYYAYCHAWTRDENGKKVFGEWSNSYPFSVTAITPDTPEILSVKAKGSTITVTYKESANSTGYDVVLGKGSKKEHGETRPYQYGKYKKLNVKPGVCKAVFKNVPAGTYYAGVHSWNRTASENDNKVFSKWSNLETAKVK